LISTTAQPNIIGFPVEAVISKVVSLEDAGASLADWAMNAKGITKIMVDFEK
jgi:hypothetical protein